MSERTSEVQSRMDRPSWVAIIALCLSIGTATFSVFQWWSGTRETAINAAINVSQKYIQDSDLAKGRNELYELPLQKEGTHIPHGREAESIKAFILFLEYVSYLTNNERLDERYLLRALKCDVVQVKFKLDLVTHFYGIQFDLPDLNRFAERLGRDFCILRRLEN